MRLIFLVFLLLLFQTAFGVQSDFVDFTKNTNEWNMLTNTESFSLIESSLIASGVKNEFIPQYLSQFSNIYNAVTKDIEIQNRKIRARNIFENMHKIFLEEYNAGVSSIDMMLKTRKYNCLSATVLYNSLLEMDGYTPNTVNLPSHVFTRLILNNESLDIENTTPYGFDIATNKQAQAQLLKMTGVSYIDIQKDNVVDKKGLIANVYANIASDYSKINDWALSFESAYKGYMLAPSLSIVSSNLKGAYTSYSAYLVDHKNEFYQSMQLLREGINLFGLYKEYIANYKASLDRWIQNEIENDNKDILSEIQKSAILLNDPLDAVRENFIIRFLYREINVKKNYQNALEFAKQTTSIISNSKEINLILLDGMNSLQNRMVRDWKKYPENEIVLLEWATLIQDKNATTLVENYYANLAERWYSQGKSTDKALEIIDIALKNLPASQSLKKSGQSIAGNTGVEFIQKKDYDKGIYYTLKGLKYEPQSTQLSNNLKAVYLERTYNEIEKENYKNALNFANEGLRHFPGDKKLLYYRDYIDQKLK